MSKLIKDVNIYTRMFKFTFYVLLHFYIFFYVFCNCSYPLGLVGIMSPFNAPVSLAFDPAIEAIAGGNRVIMKLSESTPKTAAFMTKLVGKYFKETELACVDGDLEVSKRFAALDWDKFFFTGGSEVGKKILSAAADHLTPVILELGGKSPCVVLKDADIKAAARKIGQIRVMNSGQVCISGDYAFVPEDKLEDFISHAVGIVEEKFPTIIHNMDYTAIIDDRNYNRIVGYIDEARAAGVRIIQANAGGEKLPDPKTRKIPLTVVVNPPMDLQVARYEIFGPVLTVFTYNSLDHVIKTINSNEKPLALYIFGKSRSQINQVVRNTSSGGVTVNDLLMHADASKMGFGGVGYSGMGRYKGGKIGFLAFTNPKSVVESGLMRRFTHIFQPPYTSDRSRKMLRNMVGMKE
ncbi:aldehyde dehydrogenase family protein [Acidaminobacter sp. JC074]|uniref:aldehyde dehydrogenase family protein n=1 Tax=Acidaminobacter sp. JC074 TaxID=2530199 RepID=UPI002ED5DD74